jgi:peptide/nickel transport system substrate-binding protein
MLPVPPRKLLALLLAGVLSAAAVVTAGCGGDAKPAPDAATGPQRGGQVVIGTTSDIGGINPVILPGVVITSEVIRQLFLPLVEEQPDFQTLKPRLAASWEFSDDHRQLTFHLRPDVLWSDGTPVTADDVAFTYQAWVSPETAFEGAYALEGVERVEVLDATTVRFDFTEPYSTQLLDVAAGAVILPKHAWGALPFSEWRTQADWFLDHLVTNGPFRLASWTPQQEVVLERNPFYYDKPLPYLDRVVVRVVPEQTNQLTQLLNGQLDYVLQLSPDDVPQVEANPDTRMISYWTRGYNGLGWNLARPPFDDVRVRRALTLGIDRSTLVESIWGPYGRVLATPIPPDVWAHHPDISPLPYDPDAARRLLDEAGWVDGNGDGVREKDGRPFSIRLLTNAGNLQREDALVLIQQQLARVGVEAQPEILEINSLVEKAYAGDFDGLLMGWTLPTTFDFRFAFHSSEAEGGNNFIGYRNPEMDELLTAIRAQPSIEDTGPLLARLQTMLHEEQPYTFLWQSKRLVGVRNRVHDVRPNHLHNLFNLRQWWVDPSN